MLLLITLYIVRNCPLKYIDYNQIYYKIVINMFYLAVYNNIQSSQNKHIYSKFKKMTKCKVGI